MGAEESSTNRQYLECLSTLTKKDCSNDEKFWISLISMAPPRNQTLPSPKILFDITAHYPQNIIGLYRTCIKYMEINEQLSSTQPLPQVFTDQFAFVLNLINMMSAVLIQTEHFHPILYEILGTKDQTEKANPQIEEEPKKEEKPEQATTESETKVEEKEKKEENESKEEQEKKEDVQAKDGSEQKEDKQTNEETENKEKAEEKKEDISPKPEEENKSKQPAESTENKETTEPKQEEKTENPQNGVPQNVIPFELQSINSPNASLYVRFLQSAYNILFRGNITLFNEETYWFEKNEDYSQSISRLDLIHSILFNINLPYFAKIVGTKELTMPTDHLEFPYQEFIISVFYLIHFHFYDVGYTPSDVMTGLLKNSLALCAYLLAHDHNMLTSMVDLENTVPLSTTKLVFQRILANPNHLYFRESVAMIYALLYSDPDVIQVFAEDGTTNEMIFGLLQYLQSSYEQGGLSYVHVLIVSIIELFVENSLTCACLNAPFNSSFLATFRPHRGTYADLLFEILMNFLGKEPLTLQILSTFANVAGYIDEISLYNSVKIGNAVEHLISSKDIDTKKDRLNAALTFFARIIQKKEHRNVNIQLIVYQKSKLFKELKTRMTEYCAPLEIILHFCEAAKAVFASSGKKKVSAEEASHIIMGLDIDEIFPVTKEFEKSKHEYNDYLRDGMKNWASSLLSNVMAKEKEVLRYDEKKKQQNLQKKQ